MTITHIQTVEVGDQFRDNDSRLAGTRIIQVIGIAFDPVALQRYAHVETVEHWNEKLIGRLTWVSVERLAKGRNRQTGYTKVSR